MTDDSTKPTPTSMLIDGERCDRHVRGGLAVHLDRNGHALTVGEAGLKRLPDAHDVRLLVDEGRAVPIPHVAPYIPPIIRGIRQPLAGTGSRDPETPRRVAGGVGATAGSDRNTAAGRKEADDALTMGAFVHLTDTETTELDGYEIYLRAYVGIRHRNPGMKAGIAMPSRFRDRIARVSAELARMGVADGETSTAH